MLERENQKEIAKDGWEVRENVCIYMYIYVYVHIYTYICVSIEVPENQFGAPPHRLRKKSETTSTADRLTYTLGYIATKCATRHSIVQHTAAHCNTLHTDRLSCSALFSGTKLRLSEFWM